MKRYIGLFTAWILLTSGIYAIGQGINNPQTNASALTTGTLPAGRMPALTGDITTSAGAVATTLANNAVTLAKLATQATNTVLGNATAGTAVPTALAVGTCSTAASAVIWTTNTGFGCNTSITAGAVAVGGITGLGTGVATWLATPSSANLATAVTGETGNGALVFGTSPTIATPTITGTIAGSPGLTGTTTNDNATAGNVGEYRSVSNIDNNQITGSATVTFTSASPAVVTWTGTASYVTFPVGAASCAVINFTTSGTLPTSATGNLAAGTNYYVVGASISGLTFQIARTCDDAIAGTAINTTSTGSGTHTGVNSGILTSSVTAFNSALQLTAGDWDVEAGFAFISATTTSITAMVGSTSSGAGPVSNPGYRAQLSTAAMVPGVAINWLNVGSGRYLLSATTTVYCYALSTFSVSTLNVAGGCRARRMR